MVEVVQTSTRRTLVEKVAEESEKPSVCGAEHHERAGQLRARAQDAQGRRAAPPALEHKTKEFTGPFGSMGFGHAAKLRFT
jgi:hypothetical protein